MPQIKEYDAGNLQLNPTERGVDARTQAARRIGAFASQAAGAITGAAEAGVTAANDVARSMSGVTNAVVEGLQQQEDYAGHRAISQGAADGIKLKDQLEDKWNVAVAEAAKRDPNDPTVKAKFMEQELQPALENFKAAYGGTDLGAKWADQFVQHTAQHFSQKTSADMMTLAGKAVETNVRQLQNTSAANAFKNPDFHNVDFLVGNVSNSIDAMVASSNVKGAESARLRTDLTQKTIEQIVKSAAIGAIQKSSNPEKTADEFTSRYSQYITPGEGREFASAARGAIRLNNTEARAARTEAERAARQDFRQKVNQLEGESIPDNLGDPPKMPENAFQRLRELANHPGAAFETGRLTATVKQFETISERQNKPEPLARVSHATTAALFQDLRDGKMVDLKPIYEAFGRGDLNNADFNFLVKAHGDLRSPEGAAMNDDRKEFFKRYAATIDGAMDMGGHSALGSQRMYAFEMEARRQEIDLRKKGQDPHSLYDPSSPNFLGKQVAKYHVSFDEAQKFEKQVQGERKSLNQTANPPPTGIETIEQKPGAKTFVPPANWVFSQSRQQYRDPSGNIYDVSGSKVK